MTKANARERIRHLIVWEVPFLGSSQFIEMYVNPTGMQTKETKLITKHRTKGGFIIQYFGEDFTTLSISGQTGSGGIEALNVLKDIYRSEQLAMQKILTTKGESSKRRQSLGQLATSVVMWYMGQGQRGFFQDFGYDETAGAIGIFSYNLAFTVVETIGQRKNFLPWHRKPWSTADKPVVDSGGGATTGGAYATNFKMGELNAPAFDDTTGQISDPQFTSQTGLTFTPGSNETKTLTKNLQDNNPTLLTPSNLFANR